MEYIETIPYSVKFFAVKNSKRETTIHVRIGLNRNKAEFKADIVCEEEDWDAENMRFTDSRSHNNYLNQKLSRIQGKIFESYIAIRNSGTKPTAANIKLVYYGENSKIGCPLILTYLDDYIKIISLKTDEYRPGTIAHYKTLRKYLTVFLSSIHHSNMRMNEWKRTHFVQFETHLRTTNHRIMKRPIGKSTSNKYLSKLKVIFNYALSNEIITINPSIGFTMQRVKGTTEYLTIDEIRRIEEYDFEDNISLDNVRKLFLFSVFSGLRFSDANQLKRENVTLESDNNYWVTITQQKTNEPLYRPLFKKAVTIMQEFERDYPESEYVIPRITNQKVNAYLKVIADLAGVKKVLTHHMARHSFATTILLDSGIDLKTVSFFMGHSSIKSTEVYGKITRNRAVDVVKELNCVI
jgi:site-specific recombinase XerD